MQKVTAYTGKWRQIVHWLLTSVQEKYKFRTCCVQQLFWMPKNKKTIFVHNMFWTCIFLVLKSVINEQSVVILWVNWFKNECFWKRFTCTYMHLPKIQTPDIRNFWREQDFFAYTSWLYIQNSGYLIAKRKKWFCSSEGIHFGVLGRIQPIWSISAVNRLNWQCSGS